MVGLPFSMQNLPKKVFYRLGVKNLKIIALAFRVVEANCLEVKIPIDLTKGEKLDFKAVKEDWNEYELADGARLKVKLVLIDVLRMPVYNPLGEPIYRIMSQNIVKCTYVPEELKRKPKPSATPIK